jgi:hypothetical protein
MLVHDVLGGKPQVQYTPDVEPSLRHDAGCYKLRRAGILNLPTTHAPEQTLSQLVGTDQFLQQARRYH